MLDIATLDRRPIERMDRMKAEVANPCPDDATLRQLLFGQLPDDNLTAVAAHLNITHEDVDVLHRRRQEALKENDTSWASKRATAESSTPGKPSP